MINEIFGTDQLAGGITISQSDTPIAGRRKVEIHRELNTNWGEPSTSETMKELEALAKEYAEFFFQEAEVSGYDIREVNKLTVELITGMISAQFPFREQGSGVATIRKQLEHFRSFVASPGAALDKQGKTALSTGLDCKLPTVMTGLVVHEVAAQLQVRIEKDYLFTKANDAHPSYIVSTSPTEVFLVDFHIVEPHKDLAPTFASYDEQRTWEVENSRSSFNVRDLSRNGIIALDREYINKLPLTWESLAYLDEMFLQS